MSHREDKKEAKKGNKKSKAPEIIGEDQMKKNKIKKAIE